MDKKLPAAWRGSRLKVNRSRLRIRTLKKKDGLDKPAFTSSPLVYKGSEKTGNSENNDNNVNASGGSRSKFLEKFTNCLCIQVESADPGSQVETEKIDQEETLQNAREIVQQDAQDGDRALPYELENGFVSPNLNNVLLVNKSFCDITGEAVGIWDGSVTKNSLDSEEVQQIQMGKGASALITANNPLGSNINDFQKNAAPSECRDNRKETMMNIANEVILASSLLANALATLKRCIPQTADSTASLKAHSQIKCCQMPSQMRASLSTKMYQINQAERAFDDISQVELIPDISYPPEGLTPQQIPVDEKFVIHPQTKLLICIEDLDPIERILSDRSISSPENLNKPIYPHDSRLTPRPEEWMEDSSHKLPSPIPTRLPLRKNVSTSIQMGSNSLDMATRFSSIPTVITNAFPPSSSEETQLTEMDELLSTDESESTQSLIEQDCHLQQQMSTKNHVNWPPVGCVRSLKTQTTKPFLNTFMMAGDSSASQWTKSTSFTSAGGDLGPVHEVLLSVNGTDQESSTGHCQVNFVQNKNSPVHKVRVGTYELDGLQECSYNVTKQRNNHNEKTVAAALSDQAGQNPVLNCDNVEQNSGDRDGVQKPSNVTDEEAFPVGVQTTSERPVVNNVASAAIADEAVQVNLTDNSTTSNDFLGANLTQTFGNESDLSYLVQIGQFQSRSETEIQLSQSVTPSNCHAHQNPPLPRGGGDDPLHRQRDHGLHSGRCVTGSRRRGLYQRMSSGQSRNTAPASILMNERASRTTLDEAQNFGDDVYDSILEQVHILFAQNEEDLGLMPRWRTRVHVPGPQSGDVTVQLDNEQFTDITGTLSRRAQSTVEMRAHSYCVNDPPVDS
ncbi:hypothetical protein FBUS_08651 [Fasciolopsis buskii]|uniref:Uncharacterized protein n=1 Tax=Fasciolopsis buskii TaxID=27845 RepID=A0A8E0VGE6_9TREM|nr:hypothetical protein FBUS_08651 [Fasciolopsis buski]